MGSWRVCFAVHRSIPAGPGWLQEGDAEPESPDPTQDLSASFSKKCNSITTLGDIERLFVTGKHAHDVTGRRQEESQRLQKSTRWPVLRSLVSRQGRAQAGLQHPPLRAACARLLPSLLSCGLGESAARLCLHTETCTCVHHLHQDTVGESGSLAETGS